jgi:antitoxin component of MazEF toxin-antitoxin module
MKSSDSIPLRVRGFIPPTIKQRLPADGTVAKSGEVDVDGLNLTLLLPEDADLETEEEVTVSLRNGNIYAKTRERRREEFERKAQKHLRAREQRKKRERRKREAEEFWKQYQIPFEFDIGIKGRRAGLLRGSSGTGRVSNTKNHLYVCETFEEGRLSRTVPDSRRERGEGVYLCNDDAKFRESGVRRRGPDGESYMPPVSCEQCLELMQRFEIDEDSRSEDNHDE